MTTDPLPPTVPVPVVIRLTTWPVNVALFTMPLFVPVSCKVKVDRAVMLLLIVIAAALLAVSVKVKLFAVDTPLPVNT